MARSRAGVRCSRKFGHSSRVHQHDAFLSVCARLQVIHPTYHGPYHKSIFSKEGATSPACQWFSRNHKLRHKRSVLHQQNLVSFSASCEMWHVRVLLTMMCLLVNAIHMPGTDAFPIRLKAESKDVVLLSMDGPFGMV